MPSNLFHSLFGNYSQRDFFVIFMLFFFFHLFNKFNLHLFNIYCVAINTNLHQPYWNTFLHLHIYSLLMLLSYSLSLSFRTLSTTCAISKPPDNFKAEPNAKHTYKYSSREQNFAWSPHYNIYCTGIFDECESENESLSYMGIWNIKKRQ